MISKRTILGALIIFVSTLAAKVGELDDAPGLVLMAIVAGVFGIYLIFTNKKSTVKKRR